MIPPTFHRVEKIGYAVKHWRVVMTWPGSGGTWREMLPVEEYPTRDEARREAASRLRKKLKEANLL